jgi:hypothetical protein
MEHNLTSRSIANLPAPDDIQGFHPTASHEAIAGALNDGAAPCSIKELATQAGVSTKTIQRAIADPAALQWIVSQASRLVEARLGAIHCRLYLQAMTSKNASWMRLYLDRFDPEFKKQKILEKGGATQVNYLKEMSENELSSWLQRKLRELQGVSGPTSICASEEGSFLRQTNGPDRRPIRDGLEGEHLGPGAPIQDL